MWNPIRRQISLLNMKVLRPTLHPLTHNHMSDSLILKKCAILNKTLCLYSKVFLSSRVVFLFFVFLYHSPFIYASSHRERVWLPSFSDVAEAGKDWFRGKSVRGKERETHTSLSILTADTNTKSCWWSAGMFTHSILSTEMARDWSPAPIQNKIKFHIKSFFVYIIIILLKCKQSLLRAFNSTPKSMFVHMMLWMCVCVWLWSIIENYDPPLNPIKTISLCTRGNSLGMNRSHW